ncbi:hypothetical protein [uncultured Kocuria sp.]|uniref:hypothetical protein n=1 Tax=uncultured Kocuria sp. TaxID=259305 RepID=UPI002595990D|nr:hypothetical protein [uncultured Kocuria sp.]
MKDTATTLGLASIATALGIITYPAIPGLAIAAWIIAGAGVVTFAVARIIERRARS